MKLSDKQKEMIKGKICPYCKAKTNYIDSIEVYGKSYGMIYMCRPCDAYCGVHKGTDKALGRVANKELREKKKEAHKYFDVIWKEGRQSRSNAYKDLAKHLKIPTEYCHIGMFSIKTCNEVIKWAKGHKFARKTQPHAKM